MLPLSTGSLFPDGDCVKDNIYSNDESAEDLLHCRRQVFGVDERKQIPRDKIAAIGTAAGKLPEMIFQRS
jgi:hypothetical protein